MAWNYAELSKAAKAAGGPEKLMETIEISAKAQGRREMIPWICLATATGAGITCGIIKMVNHLKKKKAVSQKTLDKAKTELIQGIKDYDAEHPGTLDVEESENAETEDGKNE